MARKSTKITFPVQQTSTTLPTSFTTVTSTPYNGMGSGYPTNSQYNQAVREAQESRNNWDQAWNQEFEKMRNGTSNYYTNSSGQIVQNPSSYSSSSGSNSSNNGMRGDLLEAYLMQMKQEQAAAKKANEQRYQEILDLYKQRYDELTGEYQTRSKDITDKYAKRKESVMSNLEGMGAQAREDIMTRGQEAASQGQQDLTSRGLTGTTILPTMKEGYRRNTENALATLEDNLRAQRASYESSLSGDELSAQERLTGDYLTNKNNLWGEGMNFMERREDEYPNTLAYADLLQQYGQSLGNAGVSGPSSYTRSTSTGSKVTVTPGGKPVGGFKADTTNTNPNVNPNTLSNISGTGLRVARRPGANTGVPTRTKTTTGQNIVALY